MSTQAGKDVIYIDIDDEITTVIDKVRGSEQRIVALVLPKRATVLQSIVNMKLLKKNADESKKHLVLITNEHSLLPLAGAVGIYVAKTLQTKPEIPTGPTGNHEADDTEEAVDMNDEDVKLDKTRPVGAYTGAAAAGTMGAAAADDDQPIELDNADLESAGAAAAATPKTPKAKKDRKLMVPDFNKFRLWLGLGALGLVAIIFLFYIALSVMPRATITIKTDSSAIQTNMDVTFSTKAKEVDEEAGIVPAEIQQTEKTQAEQVAASGQKDKGTKASGNVTMNAGFCSADSPANVPAGTGISANGLTYITQETASFTPQFVKSKCNWVASGIKVIAQNAGEKYNTEDTSLTIAGRSDVSASTSGISGGTSNIVKVVSQADIDSAKQKISSQDTSTVKSELKQALQGQGLRALDSTLNASEPEVTTSANVGDEAETVTVTTKTTYTMVGAKESDLKKLITFEVNKQIDKNKQQILDFGLNDASFKLQNQNGNETLVTMSDTAIAGTDLNLTDLKQQVAGKKSADVKQIIEANPGVTDVTVHYSPFWVSSTPKKTGKITITVEKPAVKNAQ